jgi:hypothetical protein
MSRLTIIRLEANAWNGFMFTLIGIEANGFEGQLLGLHFSNQYLFVDIAFFNFQIKSSFV